MQISVESTGGLGRRVTVLVSAERMQNELADHSPGTVHDGRVQREVINAVIQATLKEAFEQENLKPAGPVEISTVGVRPDRTLEYSAMVEIYPEINLKSLSGFTVEKPVAWVGDAEIKEMLEQLREQKETWNAVGRASEKGDRVVIDFVGSVDDKPFAGGNGNMLPVTLGSGTMISGFEEQLIGSRPGENHTLNLCFPEDYSNKEVAGKPVRFEVEIRSVLARHLPDVDDEFAKSFGVEAGLEVFFDMLRSTMERKLDQALRAMIKDQVLDALVEANNIEVPKSLVEPEIARLKQEMRELGKDDPERPGLPDSLFEPRAKRRVMLALLLPEVVKANVIRIEHERMREKLEELAAEYEDPDQTINSYRNDPDFMRDLEKSIMEEQAVECLLGQMQVKEIPRRFDEIVKG